MKLFKKDKKTIPEGKYRVIKIGKDALFELIYDSINEYAETYFDISDSTSIVKSFDINWETGEFIAIARNDMGEEERLQFDIDTQKLLEKMEDTTDTMFTPGRYKDFSESEIEEMCK